MNTGTINNVWTGQVLYSGGVLVLVCRKESYFPEIIKDTQFQNKQGVDLGN